MDSETKEFLTGKIKKKNMVFFRSIEGKEVNGTLMKIEGDFCLVMVTEKEGEWHHYQKLGFKTKFKGKE